jgi:hypothetical protein
MQIRFTLKKKEASMALVLTTWLMHGVEWKITTRYAMNIAWADRSPFDSSLESTVGVDSDVWKSELSVYVSTKNVNVDIQSYSFLIWMYSNPIFNIIRIRHYPNYLTKIW